MALHYRKALKINKLEAYQYADIEFVIKHCAKFEQYLERKYSAFGKGIHEKISSVERSLYHLGFNRLSTIGPINSAKVKGSRCKRQSSVY